MKHTTALLALLALAACDRPCADEDGDGAVASTECKADSVVDCDDTDPEVHPGATEVCNSVDDDCDGTVDVGASDATAWYADQDGDGFGLDISVLEACEAPVDYVEVGTDCDDGDAAIHPEAEESCNEIDDDCDGLVDLDDDDVVDTVTAWPDEDGDGYGDEDEESFEVCEVLEGESLNDRDCDDTDPDVSPDATEVCDPHGVDEDCSGLSDDDDPGVDPRSLGAWYPDADLDGYGDASAAPTMACDQPAGMVADSSDCDDADDQRPAVEGCRTGTWSSSDAPIGLAVDTVSYSCEGSITVEISDTGLLEGVEPSCTISGLKALPYGLSGEITADPFSEGEIDFSASGGPAYDFAGEFTDPSTLIITADQVVDDVRITVDWELTKE